MDKNILDEQINYYRARAPEYDESISQLEDAIEETPLNDQGREFAQMIEVVRALPPVEHVLELAGGTGIWTKELVKTARSVTVLDASPEMIAINQKKVGSDRVQYRLADLFNWQPDAEYDLVFFAFWISHVPPDQLLSFLERVRQSVRSGGRLMMIDEFQVLPEELPATDGIYQARTLMDGRQYTIVKVYYDPNNLKEHLTALGFENISYAKGDYFFHLSATRAR